MFTTTYRVPDSVRSLVQQLSEQATRRFPAGHATFTQAQAAIDELLEHVEKALAGFSTRPEAVRYGSDWVRDEAGKVAKDHHEKLNAILAGYDGLRRSAARVRAEILKPYEYQASMKDDLKEIRETLRAMPTAKRDDFLLTTMRPKVLMALEHVPDPLICEELAPSVKFISRSTGKPESADDFVARRLKEIATQLNPQAAAEAESFENVYGAVDALIVTGHAWLDSLTKL